MEEGEKKPFGFSGFDSGSGVVVVSVCAERERRIFAIWEKDRMVGGVI